MLSAATLLDVWERGGGRPPLQQALLLLEVVHSDVAPEALARLPIGRRDGILLDLRERAFGPDFESVAVCPCCGIWLELAFTAADVRQASTEMIDLDAPLSVSLDAYTVRFRLPNSQDLLALAADAGGDGAMPPERRLLARCVAEAEHDGAAVTVADLPVRLVTAIAERMEAADPQANVAVALTCPACDHDWEQIFDVGAFLWAEVDAWARRTLGEIHALATAYGWTEGEVLSLSARRRRLYLERVAG